MKPLESFVPVTRMKLGKDYLKNGVGRAGLMWSSNFMLIDHTCCPEQNLIQGHLHRQNKKQNKLRQYTVFSIKSRFDLACRTPHGNGSPRFISKHQYTTLCIDLEKKRQSYPLFCLPEHFVSTYFINSDLLRLIRENRVESGLAGGGGGHGGRRGGRGPGRNPKSILTVIASSNLLEIPSKFKELVSRVRCCCSHRRVSFELISCRFSALCVHRADLLPSLCLCFIFSSGKAWRAFPLSFCSLSK